MGKHVLELGCGVGFLGILIAKIQAEHFQAASPRTQSVTMSDTDDDVLERCKQNSKLPASTFI
jgi:16S rRNA G1207 methylase RsmC